MVVGWLHAKQHKEGADSEYPGDSAPLQRWEPSAQPDRHHWVSAERLWHDHRTQVHPEKHHWADELRIWDRIQRNCAYGAEPEDWWIGRKLYQYAVKQNNTGYFTVNSSPYAHEVYKHLGFEDTDEKQSVNGLIFYPMKNDKIN